MKKFIIITLLIICSIMPVLADDKTEVTNNFKLYVNYANSYKPELLKMYSPNAKIIRQVVKPDGTTANADTNMHTYSTQLKLGQAGAKLRGYKNYYSNITIQKAGNGYKISALRQPSGENYKLKIYQIWQKNNEKWLIVEEMMQTKEQIFLKYAK